MSMQETQFKERPSGLVIPEWADPDLVAAGSITVQGKRYDHLITKDFPPGDEWSILSREVIAKMGAEGKLDDRKFIEFGAGDARIEVAAAGTANIPGMIINDKEGWRLRLAEENLKRNKSTANIPTLALQGHAVAILQDWEKLTGNPLVDGVVVACLPQSPEGLNAADKYEPDPLVEPHQREWGKYGLGLNAAVLHNLRRRSTPETRGLFMVSHRMPDNVRTALFEEHGWEIVRSTNRMVHQDKDTGIHWVEAIDDGTRFWEQIGGAYRPISAAEAESRRSHEFASGKRANVYHGLSAVEIVPKRPTTGGVIIDLGRMKAA